MSRRIRYLSFNILFTIRNYWCAQQNNYDIAITCFVFLYTIFTFCALLLRRLFTRQTALDNKRGSNDVWYSNGFSFEIEGFFNVLFIIKNRYNSAIDTNSAENKKKKSPKIHTRIWTSHGLLVKFQMWKQHKYSDSK